MVQAITVGVCLILAAGLLSMAPLAGLGLPEWLLAGVTISPICASLLASWLAPRSKVLVGTLMFLPATLVVLAVTGAFQWLGQPVDFAGWGGARLLAGVTVAWNLPACLVAALMGAGLSGWSRRRSAG